MIKAVIFDFFGVVGQSTYRLIIEDLNLDESQKQQLKDLHKSMDNGFVSNEEFIKDSAEILNISKEEFISKEKKSVHEFGLNSSVMSLIKELKPNYKVGLLSNVSSNGFDQFIKPIVANFDEVVLSYQVRIAKPDEAIFEYMANKLGLDVSECVMIDDSPTNCEGARAAGMQAICFQDITQAKAELSNILE